VTEPVGADYARAHLPELLSRVLYRGENIPLSRRGVPTAVLVPPDWYARAVIALALTEQE
jgi:prevent-host-death family protein